MNIRDQILPLLDKANDATKKEIYRRLAPEVEMVTIDLPACGTPQTLNQRFGGTDLNVGDILIYVSEGVVVVERENDELFRVRVDQ